MCNFVHPLAKGRRHESWRPKHLSTMVALQLHGYSICKTRRQPTRIFLVACSAELAAGVNADSSSPRADGVRVSMHVEVAQKVRHAKRQQASWFRSRSTKAPLADLIPLDIRMPPKELQNRTLPDRGMMFFTW